MRFEQARVGAKFGCNSMGADYTQTANVLDLGPVMATRMACPDMSFEDQGGAVLNQPMTMNWSGGDRLTLSNAAGQDRAGEELLSLFGRNVRRVVLVIVGTGFEGWPIVVLGIAGQSFDWCENLNLSSCRLDVEVAELARSD